MKMHANKHSARLTGKEGRLGRKRLQNSSKKVLFRPMASLHACGRVLYLLKQEWALFIYELKAEYG